VDRLVNAQGWGSAGFSEMAEACSSAFRVFPKQSGFQPTIEPTGFQPVVAQFATRGMTTSQTKWAAMPLAVSPAAATVVWQR
jgi:hypothetical protein